MVRGPEARCLPAPRPLQTRNNPLGWQACALGWLLWVHFVGEQHGPGGEGGL